MPSRELLDVPLVPRLRPAALVVVSRRLVVPAHDLLETACPQLVDVAPLAADGGHQRTLAAADERHERREVELPPRSDAIVDALAQRQGPPDVVEPGGEDREPVRAVAVELLLEVVGDPGEVGLERLPLLVRELAPL